MRALLFAALLSLLFVPTPASASGVHFCEDGGVTVVVGTQTVADCVTSDDVFYLEPCYGDGFRYYLLGEPSPCFR